MRIKGEKRPSSPTPGVPAAAAARSPAGMLQPRQGLPVAHGQSWESMTRLRDVSAEAGASRCPSRRYLSTAGERSAKPPPPPPARSLRTALPAAAPGAADSPLPSRWVTMRWVTATPRRMGGWTDTQIYTHRRACRERAAHHTAVPSPP